MPIHKFNPTLHSNSYDFTLQRISKGHFCSLYDTRKPIDIIVSKISKRKLLPAPAQLDVIEQTFSY